MIHSTKKIISTLVIILSLTTIMYADSSRKKASNIIKFNANKVFGGSQVQGKYRKKEKTATITNGDTTYKFTMVIEDLNPWLTKNKFNLVKIGSFKNGYNRFGMPTVMYLFAAPSNDMAQKAVESTQKASLKLKKLQLSDLSDNEESDLSDDEENNMLGQDTSTYAPQRFQPAQNFKQDGLIGNYFKDNHTAIIYDPSGKNKTSYRFTNVSQGIPLSLLSNAVRPLEEPVLIGQYVPAPEYSKGTPRIYARSNAVLVIMLYGNLQK